MGDKNLRFPGAPAPPGSQATRIDTRGDYDGITELPSSRDSRHHHPVPKLQEGRQEEITIGDIHLRVPGTPGTTTRFPSYKKGDYDGRQDLASSQQPRHHHPAPKLHKLQEETQEETSVPQQ